MSHQQSRGDRSDSQQRRGARSGGGNPHQRSSTASNKGGAGGHGPSASAPLLSPAVQTAPVPSSKRPSGVNGQPRGHPPASVEGSDTPRAQQNATPQYQGQYHGHASSGPRPSMQPSNGNIPRSSRPITPATSAPIISPETTPVIPKPESWTAAHSQVQLQFGTIGTAAFTGSSAVQIPARTSSAPPNLDEQKQDQARFESINAGLPKIPPGGQQQAPRPQVQQSGGQQQGPRPQQGSIPAGMPQPQYPQLPIQAQIPQSNSHLPGQQPHLQMPGHHLVPPPPQQQGLVQNIYSQHQQGLMQFPQSMGGPQMIPPQLAPLPGQLPQMSHQMPGPLASPMPSGPYGVVPVPNHFIQPRTNRAVKIVHPETHEELRFDSKNIKTNDPSVGRGNVPHARPLSFGSGAGHHPVTQNFYPPHQNGPYAGSQNYHPSSSPVMPAPSSGVQAQQSNLSETSPAGSSAIATSFGTVPSDVSGMNSSSSIHGKSGDGRNQKSYKADRDRPPVSHATEAVAQAKDSVDAELKSNKLVSKVEGQPEVSTVHKDLSKGNKGDGYSEASIAQKDATKALQPGKDVQQNPVHAMSSKEGGHRADAMPEVKQGSKKKKKKDGKKQVEAKVADTYKAKVVTPEVAHTGTSRASESSSMSTSIPADDVNISHSHSPPVEPNSSARETNEGNVVMEDKGLKGEDTIPECHPVDSVEAAMTGLSLDSSTIQLKPMKNESSEVNVSREQELQLSDNVASLNLVTEDKSNLDNKGAQTHQKGDSVQSRQEELKEETGKSVEKVEPASDSKQSSSNLSVSEKPSADKVEKARQLLTEPSVPVKEEDVPVFPTTDVKQGSKKKKMKDILAKADAAGTTADLYNAYKAPEETKVETPASRPGNTRPSTAESVKQVSTPEQISAPKELDDWEDAVELPSPNVLGAEGGANAKNSDKLASELKGGETYTRDFLLTFKEQNTDLPLDFEVRPDIAELLVNPQLAFARAAERVDRHLSGGPRRGVPPNTFDEDKWIRQPPGLNSPVWPDNYGDVGFRPGNVQGLIPRMPNMRPSGPGLIPGRPSTPMGRGNTVDSDRWLRVPAGQRGLIPSPHNLPPVHKAKDRYEVGKASDAEQLKQRQMKGILNKLTPQNFEKLFEQVKEVKIQSAATLTGVISQIFDKALTEPTFCEMYATFCKQLAADMPEFIEDGEKVTFKRVLLNKCQEEFHRGEKEQDEAGQADEEGKEKSPEEREELRIKAKRRMLGNIRFIGELYKKHMLTEKIMHECIRKLLGQFENPEEEDVEALCKLISTIGNMIDQPKAKSHMDAYFDRMNRQSNNQKLPPRIRFMLKDVIDLRRNGWQERRKVEGPKKLEEVHRDAVQERQATVAQAGRLSRGPSMGGSSGRRIVSPDFPIRGGPGSPMYSPGTPVGTGPQMRGQAQLGVRGPFAGQDVRIENRLLLENKPVPMPLSRDEGPLTLGPQGGLGRAMSMRAQGSGPGLGVAPPDRRFAPVNMPGYNIGAERPQTPPERPLLDRPVALERFGPGPRSARHLERTLSDRSVSTSNSGQQGSRPSTAPASVHLTEDELEIKSKNALTEYFSARDLKEVTQCVEELRAPKYYSTMVHTWITVALDMKNMERELLVKLLIHLSTSEPFLLNQTNILEGFQMVMELLEDLSVDVPMAPDYLSKMLVALIAASVISFEQVRDILRANEVVQAGYALNMLAGVLVGLRQEKGEKSMVEIFQSSRIRLEDFVDSDNNQHRSIHDVLSKYNLQNLIRDTASGVSSAIVQQLEKQLSGHLTKQETIQDTIKWLETNASPAVQSDLSFHRMLMTQVLKHSYSNRFEKGQSTFDTVRDRLSDYGILLQKFASDNEKQLQYVLAAQDFVHGLGHPTGLMTTLVSTLYDKEVVSQSTYLKWQDNTSDPTPGREKAISDASKWLNWLRTTPRS